MRLTICALAVPLLLAPLDLALGWGATGHEFVSGIAAESLPDEVPAFVRTPEAIDEIAVLGRELDRSKGAGQSHDAKRDPGHFIALDGRGMAGDFIDLEALPATREAYDGTLRQNTRFTQYSARGSTRTAAAASGW